MLSYTQALEIVLSHCPPASTATRPLADLLGLTLAQATFATEDSPRFDNSSVDGFAIVAADLGRTPASLKIVDTVEAGSTSSTPISTGQAARIYTGAPIPEGADAVVMQEDCRWDHQQVTIDHMVRRGEFIRTRGQEYKRGDQLLPAGTLVTPPVLGLLAGNGISQALVKEITATVVVTGNELEFDNEALGASKIRDSNGPALLAALHSLGVKNVNLRHCSDEPETVQRVLEQALNESQIVITCGGVSVGDHDLVKGVFEELGVERHVWGVKMRPGKPFYFGTKGEKLVFGLPGNPVSTLVCFYVFCRPALLQMQGHAVTDPIKAILTTSIAGGDRYEFVRGHLEDGLVHSLEGQESFMNSTLAAANCLIHVPEGTVLEAGDEVLVTELIW
jgi:molybdopterin molybdotransferase